MPDRTSRPNLQWQMCWYNGFGPEKLGCLPTLGHLRENFCRAIFGSLRGYFLTDWADNLTGVWGLFLSNWPQPNCKLRAKKIVSALPLPGIQSSRETIFVALCYCFSTNWIEVCMMSGDKPTKVKDPKIWGCRDLSGLYGSNSSSGVTWTNWG